MKPIDLNKIFQEINHRANMGYCIDNDTTILNKIHNYAQLFSLMVLSIRLSYKNQVVISKNEKFPGRFPKFRSIPVPDEPS